MKSLSRLGGMNRHQRRALARSGNQRNAPVREPISDEPVERPEQGGDDPVVAAMRELLEAQRQEQAEATAEAIASLRKPKRVNVPQPPAPDQQEPSERYGRFGFGDVSDVQDLLYRSLPAVVRQIRNPRSDAGVQAWIRALRWNDLGTMERCRQELDAEFRRASGERATYLYGTPNATSGLGGGSGGPLVPLPLASLITLARDREGIGRSLFQRFTSNANTLRVPTAGVATAAMVAEGATASQGEPVPASILLSKKKAQAKFRTSDEMLEDSAFNLISFFAERAGSALGALEDTQFATSNGTAPNITTSLIAGVTNVAEATSTVLVYRDTVTLFFALPKPYRRDAIFAADGTTLRLLSSLLDGNGRPIMAPGLSSPMVVEDTVPGQVGTIFGRPVVDLPFASGTLWVGSPRLAYSFLDGGPLNIRTSEHVAWATDEVEWKVTERFDGAVTLADAARVMTALATVA